MTLTPVDYFLRRTNYMLFKREQMEAMVEPVLQAMASYYGWSQAEKEHQAKQLEEALAKNDLCDLK